MLNGTIRYYFGVFDNFRLWGKGRLCYLYTHHRMCTTLANCLTDCFDITLPNGRSIREKDKGLAVGWKRRKQLYLVADPTSGGSQKTIL